MSERLTTQSAALFTQVPETLERAADLDPFAQKLADAAPSWLRAGAGREILGGKWLGHPLHPVLTDIPIGSWTSAWVLDIVGGKGSRRAATGLVGLGVVSAIPTIASGWSDYLKMSPRDQRVGVVHATANSAACALYALSFVMRVRGKHGRGVAFGMAGAACATAGGLLGGHLVFGSSKGDDSESDDNI